MLESIYFRAHLQKLSNRKNVGMHQNAQNITFISLTMLKPMSIVGWLLFMTAVQSVTYSVSIGGAVPPAGVWQSLVNLILVSLGLAGGRYRYRRQSILKRFEPHQSSQLNLALQPNKHHTMMPAYLPDHEHEGRQSFHVTLHGQFSHDMHTIA